MPAKKAASKKQKHAGTGRKKAASRKPSAGRKASGNKRKLSTKKSSRKKAPTKKAAARKKPTAKKSTVKKAGRKKSAGRVSKKSATKSAKAAPRKKAAAKPSAKKGVGSKKESTKKPVKKAASPKKAAAQTSRPGKATPAASSMPVTSSKAARGINGAKRPSRQDLLAGPIHGIEPYAMRRGEEYMSPEQLAHFEAILTAWKRELMNEVDRTVHHMQDEAANFPDPNDRATQESEFGLELRTRDRERKLLRKIDAALQRIEEGTYGYCDETGEEIGLKRLEARPVATLSLEAQERREMAERQFRDRDDRYR